MMEMFSLLLISCLAGRGSPNDSYLRYYPPFYKDDFSHYGAQVECYTGIGESYAGNQNYTASGRPCVDWKQTKFSSKAKCVYCRNPDSDSTGPWCYVDGLGETASCSSQIPVCARVYQFQGSDSAVKIQTHRWKKTNKTNIIVSFKPYIPPKLERSLSYTILHIQGEHDTYISVSFDWKPLIGGSVLLEWRYHEEFASTFFRSETLDYAFYRVHVNRSKDNITLTVNSKVYRLQSPFPSLEFNDIGVIEIGYTPETDRTRYKGCVANVVYDGTSLLDYLEGDRSIVSVTGNVSATDTCMYVAPHGYVTPPYSSAANGLYCSVVLVVLTTWSRIPYMGMS